MTSPYPTTPSTSFAFTEWTALPGPAVSLGESPFWQAQENRLYWVDIAGRALLRWQLGSDVVDRWALPSEPGCFAPVRSGGESAGWVIALRNRVCHAARWGGELNELATLPFDPQTQRANDGKCDALGRFWIGTIHEPASGPRQPVGALYCVDLRALSSGVVVRKMLDGVSTANGLAWSPDGKKMYWSDTPAHVICEWDCNAEHEPVGAARVFQQFAHKPAQWQPGMPGYMGRPDGATVDAQGNYWCAMYEGARVLCFSAQGELLADLPTPVQCPTMPCLGGAEGQTRLFVTSASQGRPAAELEHMPLSGGVLSMALHAEALPVNWCVLEA